MLRLVFFLILTVTFQANASNNLPDLGASDLKDYDSQTETLLGKSFSTALHTQYPLIYDATLLSYIRRIGEKITGETGQNRHYSFFIIDNPTINAFAGPNGIIGIHTGLIASARSEDELASVMAHEIAHVTQRHLSRTYENQSTASTAGIASILAAILIGSQNPTAGVAAYMGSIGLNIEKQLKNSRIHESEADYFGIKYLNEAGYNPFAMGDFFDRLSKESQLFKNTPPEILMTHPVTENRLAKARDRAEQMNTQKALSYDSLKLMQMRLAFVSQTHTDPFENSQLKPEHACYLRNLKVLYLPNQDIKQFDHQCLEAIIAKNPDERVYKQQLIEVKVARQDASALLDLERLMDFYPSDFAIPYLYARSLAYLGHRDKAIELLRNRTPNYHYQYLLYSTLAELFAQQQQPRFSYYYDALANYNIGNIPKTHRLLKQLEPMIEDKKSTFYLKVSQLLQETEQTLKLYKNAR